MNSSSNKNNWSFGEAENRGISIASGIAGASEPRVTTYPVTVCSLEQVRTAANLKSKELPKPGRICSSITILVQGAEAFREMRTTRCELEGDGAASGASAKGSSFCGISSREIASDGGRLRRSRTHRARRACELSSIHWSSSAVISRRRLAALFKRESSKLSRDGLDASRRNSHGGVTRRVAIWAGLLGTAITAMQIPHGYVTV